MNTKKVLMKHVHIRIAVMVAVLVGAFFFSMYIGRYEITPSEVIKTIVGYLSGDVADFDPLRVNVIMQVRLPRILLSLIIGAGLACSGAAYQCLFRNPLVSPDILGVSAGSGFGAALAILLGAGAFMIQVQALVFGLAAVVVVMLIARVEKSTHLYMLVLSGVIVEALFEAFISLTKYVADPQDTLPAITMWLMGSLASVSYKKVFIALVTIVPCIVVLFLLRWKMNLLSLDEEEAKSLGVKVEKLKIVIIVVSTLMTAVSVSLCGVISWIGLVIPHIARFFVGSDHRGIVPASMILGAIYLLLIDDIARTLTAAELPISILTSIVGAPFFAVMLRRSLVKKKG